MCSGRTGTQKPFIGYFKPSELPLHSHMAPAPQGSYSKLPADMPSTDSSVPQRCCCMAQHLACCSHPLPSPRLSPEQGRGRAGA